MSVADSSPTLSGSTAAPSKLSAAAVAVNGAAVPISPRTRATGAVLRGGTLR